MGVRGNSEELAQTRWAPRIIGGVLLAIVAVATFLLAIYEYNNWNTATSTKGIVSDYSSTTYLVATVVAAILCVASLSGIYAVWHHRSH